MNDKTFNSRVSEDGAQRSANVRKKLSLGPLPAQVDDYQIEEKIDLRWDRIAIAGALALALIWAAWNMVRPGTEPASTEQLTPQLGQQPDDTGSSTRIEPEVKEPASEASQDEQLAQAINQLPAPSANVPKQPELAPVNTDAVITNLSDAVHAALSIQDAQVTSGYLQSVGSTFDTSGSGATKRVALPKRGILKMELRASLTAVQGQTLYHQWLRNGKPQAKITINPTTPTHESFSSKYINQQMRGDWQARVLDASGKVLAQADFTVY